MASAMLVPLMVPTFSVRSSSTVFTTRCGWRVSTTLRVGKTSSVKRTSFLRDSVTVKRPAIRSPFPDRREGMRASQEATGTGSRNT